MYCFRITLSENRFALFRMMLSRTLELEFRMEAGNVARQAFHHSVRGHVVGKIDGTRKAGGVGSTVALDDDAVQAKKNAAIQLARVQLLFQRAKRALRQHRSKASQ